MSPGYPRYKCSKQGFPRSLGNLIRSRSNSMSACCCNTALYTRSTKLDVPLGKSHRRRVTDRGEYLLDSVSLEVGRKFSFEVSSIIVVERSWEINPIDNEGGDETHCLLRVYFLSCLCTRCPGHILHCNDNISLS